MTTPLPTPYFSNQLTYPGFGTFYVSPIGRPQTPIFKFFVTGNQEIVPLLYIVPSLVRRIRIKNFGKSFQVIVSV